MAERVHRPPLTGFGTSIARARCYKQVTPNGVLSEAAGEAKDLCEVQRGYLHLTRISRVAKAVSAPRVNPVRGDLCVASRPWKLSQTPLGVTCGQGGDGRAVHRSPLTGFGTSIARARCYKQVTPNGVLGQAAGEAKDPCKVRQAYRALQTLREVGGTSVGRGACGVRRIPPLSHGSCSMRLLHA